MSVANLDGLDLEVEGNEGEDEALWKRLYNVQSRNMNACLQILHQIVKDTESFRVLAILDINQGPYFCSLTNNEYISNYL